MIVAVIAVITAVVWVLRAIAFPTMLASVFASVGGLLVMLWERS